MSFAMSIYNFLMLLGVHDFLMFLGVAGMVGIIVKGFWRFDSIKPDDRGGGGGGGAG